MGAIAVTHERQRRPGMAELAGLEKLLSRSEESALQQAPTSYGCDAPVSFTGAAPRAERSHTHPGSHTWLTPLGSHLRSFAAAR